MGPIVRLAAGVRRGVYTLVGAMLGGLAGMRYHRRVDRAGFSTDSASAAPAGTTETGPAGTVR